MIASTSPLIITALLIGAALVLLLAEALWPRRGRVQPRGQRWRSHAGFVLINMPVERGTQALVLIGLHGAATAYAFPQDHGLLGLINAPVWLEWTIAILALDFAVWLQHLATHRIGWLWRLHRVHHADRDFDMSTALRFHPVEIGLSMLYKMGVALVLGVPLGALILFELLLSLFPLFNHANIALPRWLDGVLRWLVVTPDMHRVHHSAIEAETNSNYGFCFALWDRLFGTYRAQPANGHQAMTIGLNEWQDDETAKLGWSLWLPFR